MNYYFEELFTRKYVDGKSMSDHIAQMLDLTHCITATGEKLSDRLITRSLVISLPRTPQWDLIKSQIFQLDKKSLTSETVSSHLQTEANRRSREVSLENTALLAKKGKKKARGPKVTDLCCGCGEHGHWVKDCPNTNESKNVKSSKGSANLIMELIDLGSHEIG